MRSVLGLVLAGLLQASQFELDCAKPGAARSLIGRARLSEIERAEDVKGIGEAATIGSTPAIANAVLDALAPLGVTHLDLPLTAPKVWSAMQSAPKR